MGIRQESSDDLKNLAGTTLLLASEGVQQQANNLERMFDRCPYDLKTQYGIFRDLVRICYPGNSLWHCFGDQYLKAHVLQTGAPCALAFREHSHQ